MADDTTVLMEVKGLMIDPTSNNPIVILRDPQSEAFLPIWIGVFEASAIQLGLEQVESPRPRTHDLLASVVAALDAEVVKVVVQDLREQTFYAVVHLAREGGVVEVDARPSDAIALALRTGSPLYVSRDVLEKAQVGNGEATDERERVRKLLEEMDPEDLGEYEM